MRLEIIDRPLQPIENEKDVIDAIETAYDLGFQLGNATYGDDYRDLCDIAYNYLDALKTNVDAYLKRRRINK